MSIKTLCISYKLNTWLRDLNIDFTLDNCLLGVVKLTKDTEQNKYGCSSYGIELDARSQFLWSEGSLSKNVIVLLLICASLCMLIIKRKIF